VSTYIEPVAARTDWETPQWLFDHLDAEFHFILDVCANEANKKCKNFCSDMGLGGLYAPWHGSCWMNPPYGKEIGKWIERALHSAQNDNCTVVCLLPARSNCDWWKYVIQGEVRFIRRKLRFVGGTSVSMFPNVIVIFRPLLERGGTMSIMDVRP